MSASRTIGQQVAGMELMDKLTTLCKRRGFVFANSEVYTGLAGFWDYGPLGVELKRNIERFWWDFMVRRRDNVVGLDSSCIGPEAVWKASGHVDAFNDALVDDKNSKERFRIDQLLYESEEDAEAAEVFALKWLDDVRELYKRKNEILQSSKAMADVRANMESTLEEIQAEIENREATGGDQSNSERLETLRADRTSIRDDIASLPSFSAELTAILAAIKKRISPDGDPAFWDALKEHIGYYPNNPNTGKPSRFTIPRQFNLMFKQGIGATGEGAQVGYLRAETCQPIFVDFDNIRTSSRQKVPFGIAQIGKAFRNEINPRNFLFRAREFTQMELEFFVKPDALQERLGASAEAPAAGSPTLSWYHYWLSQRREYYKQLRIPDEMLRVRDHPPEKLAHYAKAACDIEFHFPFGWGELEGVHHRGQYDLAQHQRHSGKRFEYYDDEAEAQLIAGGMDKAEARALATYLPACIETSVGLDRTFLAVLAAAYYEDLQDTKHEGKDEDIRLVLRLHPRLAPITCAIFPLSKKLSGPDSRAYKLYRELLDAGLAAEYDDAGSIGKRYRRQDEIGTPWCITYDFESEADGAVTIRDRDSLAQDRIGLGEVAGNIMQRLAGSADL